MTQQMDIEQISPVRLAGLTFDSIPATVGADVSNAYERIFGGLAAAGIAPAGPPRLMYHRMDENGWTIEAAVPVARDAEPQDLDVSDIPGGRAAVLIYVGPYNGLGTAWESMRSQFESQGLTPRAVPYEEYLSDPSDTEPSKLETKIVWPIE